MSLTWLPYVKERYAPACCEDYVQGKPLYQRLGHGTENVCMVEIVVIDEQDCETIAGPTRFLTWEWKEFNVQVCQGHLHERRFEDECAYEAVTTCPCRLFIQKLEVPAAFTAQTLYLV